MRKIIGIGETVYDIVFRDGQPQAGVPGGSTFNTMISAGRCGADSCFLSEVGSDRIGSLIKEFMAGNGVSTDYINTLPGKSPVSLAFLNARNDAEYSFYRDSRESHPDFRYPQVATDDIVVFGSFYALNRVVRPQVKAFLEYARSRGAILYYDVNFRPSHKKDLGECMDSIFENFSLAHILRGSHEDFITLFEEGDPARVYDRWVGPRCSEFICTCGADPLSVRSPGFVKEYPVRKVSTVSTIGAGDSFNAGIAFALVKEGITRNQVEKGLDERQWDALVQCAVEFSSDCCASMENYVSREFGARMAGSLGRREPQDEVPEAVTGPS